jgi:glycosyltransferase involved in cell wall biosynthesis
MRAGFDVTPVYLANPVGVRRLLSYLWSSRPRRESAWGTEGIAVDHFAHLEVFQHLVPAFKVRKALRGFDAYQVIRGGNLGESFFALSGYPFVDWVGTTIADERRTQTWSRGPHPKGSRLLAVANRATYRLLLKQEGWMLKRAARVCAVSRYTRDRIVEAHGLPMTNLDVIPNPIDTERFTPAPNGAQRSHGRSLLCVGRLDDPRKNLGLLLEAFSRLCGSVPGVTLKLVGPLDRPEWLTGRLAALGITGAVVHLGGVNLERLVRLYQEVDVVVLSSRQEGFGMVLAEAMACGTPVVATRCGGPEDVVRDGETGFLVPCDDPITMANAIEQLLVDDRLRHRMGEAARAHVCQSFSLDVVGAKILDVYRRVYPGLEVE